MTAKMYLYFAIKKKHQAHYSIAGKVAKLPTPWKSPGMFKQETERTAFEEKQLGVRRIQLKRRTRVKVSEGMFTTAGSSTFVIHTWNSK